MSRTWLSVVTALVLVAGSLALALARRSLLGHEIEGPAGASTWRITLVITGELTGGDNPHLVTALPRSFRRQHIFDEQLQSAELFYRLIGGEGTARREARWERQVGTGGKTFRASYSFRCLLDTRRPTPAMVRLTREIDASPGERDYLKPSPRIESADRGIMEKARQLAEGRRAPLDQVKAFLDFVEELGDDAAFDVLSAARTLEAESGDSGGKSRLLVALCRSRGIPARLLSGLVLRGEREVSLRYWAEAWVNGHWMPLDPTYGYFGKREFPTRALVLHIGDEPPVRGQGVSLQYRFLAREISNGSRAEAAQPSALKTFFRQTSLHALPPAEQFVVKFLLLLPLAALIASFFRTVIGVPTFGTFAPALLGLIFLDARALVWGLLLFLFVVAVAWLMRRLLEPYRLLQVPRISVLMTLVVIVLIAVILAAHRLGISATHYVSLFPLVILTHLVERYWTMEVEDGPASAFKTLLGTLLVVVVVSLACSPRPVTAWMFRYPETLGAVLACQLLLGRYTGYRLTELYRFRDLMEDESRDGIP